MRLTITCKTIPEQPVLLIRRSVVRSELATMLAECFGKLFTHGQRAGLAIGGAPLARYIAMGAGLWTVEAAMPLAAPAAAAGEMQLGTLPGGPTAFAVHVGPYELLPASHAAIERWIKEQGYEVCGAPWESYVTDPAQQPNPEDWRTEIYWPIRLITTEEQFMKKLMSILAVSLVSVGPALASDQSDIMAVLNQWNDSDEVKAVAACADDASVIDDIAPFEWHGPGACAQWQKAYDAWARKTGVTDGTGTVGKPRQLMIEGDRAYAVVPTTFAYTRGGKPTKITGTTTFTLHRTAAGWRITGWTWATLSVS